MPSRFENNHVIVVPAVPVFADRCATGLPSAPLYVRNPDTTLDPGACDNTVSPTNKLAPSTVFVRNRMLPSTLYTVSCVTDPDTTFETFPTSLNVIDCPGRDTILPASSYEYEPGPIDAGPDTDPTACGRSAPAAGYVYDAVETVPVVDRFTSDVLFPVAVSYVYSCQNGSRPPNDAAEGAAAHVVAAFGVHAEIEQRMLEIGDSADTPDAALMAFA
ncbi:hypothetical protein [Microbacterium natoriense]